MLTAPVQSAILAFITRTLPDASATVVGEHLDELGLLDENASLQEVLDLALTAFFVMVGYFEEHPHPELLPSVVIALRPEQGIAPADRIDRELRDYVTAVDVGTPPEVYLYPRWFKSAAPTDEEYRLPLLLDPPSVSLHGSAACYLRYWREAGDIGSAEPFNGAMYLEYHRDVPSGAK
ncbi:hypothetical protein [Dactylosporangium sp. NPDC051484]|uniref:hypothetical protein n=1 Tax=Dactylosporangium sp. NPDC051484 TaxID=3154942 RepID=UPI0034502DC9